MELKGKKCLFMVQGEGRGHMTQSTAMKTIIEQAGMELCGVLIGKSERRVIPDFYYSKIGAPITTISSPNFETDKKGKSIKTLPSLIKNIHDVPVFMESLKVIDKKIKELKPDLIINFYEPLCGIHYMLHRPKTPMISIAHQNIFLYKSFHMPDGPAMAKSGLKAYTSLTAIGAKRRLALSLYPYPDDKRRALYAVPPLLRKEALEQKTTTGNYLLVYLLNSGYMDDIIAWHKKNLSVELHCFTDKTGIEETTKYDDTLFFHKINDKKFLDLMAGSKGLASTAGFESICEAMYMGKPVLMVPVDGHYEQFCNSRDAAKAGAGIYDTHFNLDAFLAYLATYKPNKEYKEWVDKSAALITEHIRRAMRKG